jgi:hypothetical protein
VPEHLRFRDESWGRKNEVSQKSTEIDGIWADFPIRAPMGPKRCDRRRCLLTLAQETVEPGFGVT